VEENEQIPNDCNMYEKVRLDSRWILAMQAPSSFLPRPVYRILLEQEEGDKDPPEEH